MLFNVIQIAESGQIRVVTILTQFSHDFEIGVPEFCSTKNKSEKK